MSTPILKSLKLTTAQPVRASNDPVERARNKVIAALAEQKLMAEAKLAGQNYAPTHMVWRKNEDGQRVQVETPRGNGDGSGRWIAVNLNRIGLPI